MGEAQQLWEVVGGQESGGIVVRAGEILSSTCKDSRLSSGAVVREVALVKERLSYELVSGTGPQDGWVSLRIKGKELLVKTSRQEESHAAESLPRGTSTPSVAGKPRPKPAPLGRATLRVLALHGGGSNSRIMEYQTMALKKALGDKAEWHFLNGGREWPSDFKPNEMILALAKGEPLRGWYAVHDDGDPTKLNTEKLFDVSVSYSYDKVEEGVDRCLAYMKEKGPFDVILGFSQGCIVSHLMAGLVRDRDEPIPWRLSVLFCGMRVRDNRYLGMFDNPLSVPCVQVYGKSDEFYTYGSESQPQMYTDPVILEHDEGHKFPTAKPRSTEIYDRIVQEVLWHCGMSDSDPAIA